MNDFKKITDYFRGSLYEARSSYSLWIALRISRSIPEVGEKNATRYVEIQNQYKNFFTTVERACLTNFIISIYRCFENRSDSYSLKIIDKKGVEGFIKDNQLTFDKLKEARHKLFAHRDLEDIEIQIPSGDDMEVFFNNLFIFYNSLTQNIDDSTTLFENPYKLVVQDTDFLLKNLYRGHAVFKNENEIKWLWEKTAKSISDRLLE